MSERLKSVLFGLLQALLFVAFVAMVIVGRTPISWGRLGLALVGLVGLLVMLYLYNRRHR